jgi:hypothetical protein
MSEEKHRKERRRKEERKRKEQKRKERKRKEDKDTELYMYMMQGKQFGDGLVSSQSGHIIIHASMYISNYPE